MQQRTLKKQAVEREAAKADTQEAAPKQENKKTSNEDLKKLIESLKQKIGTSTTQQKKAPPPKRSKGGWNRSIKSEWKPNPAYNVLTRISNHEKVPTKNLRPQTPTIKSLPHSFLYKPGADGIKVDKVQVEAGKQVGWG